MQVSIMDFRIVISNYVNQYSFVSIGYSDNMTRFFTLYRDPERIRACLMSLVSVVRLAANCSYLPAVDIYLAQNQRV